MSNPGPKLYKSQLGGEQPIPPKFIAAMERSETKQAVPNEVGPEPLGDEIVESTVGTDRTNERVRTTIRKKSGPITLRDIRTNQAGTPVQVVLTLIPTGSPPTTLPGPGVSMAIEDLGNGWSIQEVAVEGVYDDNGDFHPGVFSGNVFMREREDLTPPAFRAEAEMVTRETRVAGVAADPVPLGTDLEKRETQETPFVKRLYRRFRDAVLGTSITHFETDRDKEFITVTEELKDEADPSPPDALTDVETINLGDGRIVETRKTRPEVFPGTQSGRSIPDAVPDRFKVAIPTEVSEVTSAGEVESPTLEPGELEHQETQVQKFVRRVRSVYRTAASLGTSLVSSRTTQEKQVETVTETYQADTEPLPAPSATTRVTRTNLGNQRVIDEVASVPDVFIGKSLTRSVPDVLPPEFQVGLPTVTRETSDANQVEDPLPTVTAGELEQRQVQTDKFVRRVTKRVRQVIGSLPFPVPAFLSHRTNEKKQLVAVTRQLKTLATPTGTSLPSALKSVTTTNLGDGTMLEELQTDPELFTAQEYAKMIPDAVPEEFRVLAPTVEDTHLDSTSAAQLPTTLGVGELEHRETQIDKFVKRVYSKVRSAVGAPSLTNTEVTTEYGGGVLNIVRTLAAFPIQTVVGDFRRIRGFVKDLGNNTSIKETADLPGTDTWPFLSGTDVDEDNGLATQTTQQVVPPSTVGGVDYSFPGQVRITKIEVLDRWRSLAKGKIVYDNNLLAVRQIFPVTIPIQLPRVLESITAHPEGNGGGGYYEEGGSNSWSGTGGTAFASAGGTAEASAAQSVDLEIHIKEYASDAVDGFEALFYGLANESITTVLARLTNFAGVAVTAWPKFTPKEHSIVCYGEERSLTFRGNVNASHADSLDYLGRNVGRGDGFSSGTGSSMRVGATLKLVRIPPTVHGPITIGGLVGVPKAFGNVYLTIGLTGIVPATIIQQTVEAGMKVLPGSLPTTGVQIPPSGLKLYRLRAEPYLSKYVKYHATIVDFSTVV